MANSTMMILNLIIVLVFVICFFAVLDRLLKSGAKKSDKKKETKKNEEKKAEPVEEKPVVNKPQPTMKIYNSELADDLNEILKTSQADASIRLKIENQMKNESNIAKYIKSKNYQSFNFESNLDDSEEDVEKPLSFSIEDYKRIVALSNIDDKK